MELTKTNFKIILGVIGGLLYLILSWVCINNFMWFADFNNKNMPINNMLLLWLTFIWAIASATIISTIIVFICYIIKEFYDELP